MKVHDPIAALNRIEDAMLDDIMSLTDEEVLAEAVEDGIDVPKRVAELRQMIAAAIAKKAAP